MRHLALTGLVCLVVMIQSAGAKKSQCDSETEVCHSNAYVTSMVSHLRRQLHDAQVAASDSNCTICWSQPCLNNGTCVVQSINKYKCECPDNTSGKNCENVVTCGPNSCGNNTICSVQNHQLNCVCKPGYSGNPAAGRGCSGRTRTSCISGDPHYQTFDNLYYDYQGTCPYVLSEPCSGALSDGYATYRVMAKNKLISVGAHVSRTEELEVTFYDQVVHVTDSMDIYVNGLRRQAPFYFPSRTNTQVRVLQQNSKIRILNDQEVEVTFENSRICITVPDVPAFQGNGTLCGLAGNIDNRCSNDMRLPDGTVMVPPDNPQSCAQNGVPMTEVFGDAWIDEFVYFPVNGSCQTGQIVTNSSINCDTTEMQALCRPILDAINGIGVFGQCQGLGNETLTSMYNDCFFDGCRGYDLCTIFTAFVRTCQAGVPGSSYTGWRGPPLNCTLACGLNSDYSECSSNCPSTCADPDYAYNCPYGCTEGCVCWDGYVVDNTSPENPQPCIPVEQCGCSDLNGNSHPANKPWLSNNCTLYSVCEDGQYYYNTQACDPNGFCGNIDGMETCICKPGYTGNGTSCEDINECLDPTTCGAGQGHGNCTNLPGTYNCTCNDNWSGQNCDQYSPRRHCADLYKYQNDRIDGLKTIYPTYPINDQPALSPITVYCDQTLLGGGWTLMAAAKADINAGKSMAEYVQGYGDAGMMDYWMGLSMINGMTNEMNTSMRLDLHRCGRNGQQARDTNCVYPWFTVLDNSANYSVVVPEECVGTEPQFYDGWVRWTTDIGPQFLAYDTDTSVYNCTAHFLQTGWWYDTENRCGSANLNGNRYTCASVPPIDELNSYLEWSGNPLSNVEMYLRPYGFPDYD